MGEGGELGVGRSGNMVDWLGRGGSGSIRGAIRLIKASATRAKSGIGTTTPVGSYSPGGDSPCGAADMAGNVWEWVADWYDSGYYKRSPADNPQGPESGDGRVVRGGSYSVRCRFVRCASRYGDNPDYRVGYLGFRVVCVSPPIMPLDSGHSGLWHSESVLDPEYSAIQ